MAVTALHRLGRGLGLAVTAVGRQPRATMLSVVGIAVAVLSLTLLVSVGAGVVETGADRFETADRDLWITAGPLELAGGGNPVQNPLTDAHTVADEIQQRDSVRTVSPLAIEATYIGTDPEDLTLVTGVGIPNTHNGVTITEGRSFDGSGTHYANGSYDGPMTGEVLLSTGTADRLGVEVGDEIYVGGSQSAAQSQSFEVVGLTPDFTQLLGSPTVVLRLSELQTVAGTAGSDRATFITVTTTEEGSVAELQSELQSEYPAYEVRTNRQQLEAIVGDQAVVISAGIAVVVVAIVGAVALVTNLLALVVAQQRSALAALQVLGLSPTTIRAFAGGQGVLLGLLGGSVGVALTPIATRLLDLAVRLLTGFSGVTSTPRLVYPAGLLVAVVVGSVAAMVASWNLLRSSPHTSLRHS